ncbi:MAG TPA: hypothetical protein VMS77_09845 [Conexivisphaerales archaeon]|nr:hypothetical protein [Conexivisphaerales archaeon]
MITVYAKNDCGCCTTEMRFNDLTSAREAFAAVGLGNGMQIKDDAGDVHERIDTFYGFSESDEEEHNRSLGFLLGQIGSTVPKSTE